MDISSSFLTQKPAISQIISWPVEQSVQQDFSHPSSIIYYISKKPTSPTVYLKLAQSCKYFFEKLPLLVAKDLYGITRLCPNYDKECSGNKNKCCVNIDLTKLSSKIWLINLLYVVNNNIPNFCSLLCSKIYRCDVNSLDIHNQYISFVDFKYVAISAKQITLSGVKMVYDNGSIVMLDSILEACPIVEHFKLYRNPSTFGPSTVKNITKLINLSNLRYFSLLNIPTIPKVDDFLIIFNKHKNASFLLVFDPNVSEEFNNQLNAIIDTVIEDETLKCLIQYNGQNDEKLKIMQKRFY